MIVAESTNPSAELTAYNHDTGDFLGSIVDGKLNLKIDPSPFEVRVESNLGGSATQIVQPS